MEEHPTLFSELMTYARATGSLLVCQEVRDDDGHLMAVVVASREPKGMELLDRLMKGESEKADAQNGEGATET